MEKKFFNYGVRVALIYWLVSIVWIFTSDEILQALMEDINNLTHYQTIKGLIFVSLSALLIHFLILYYQEEQKKIENKIIENEERLRLLIDNSRDAIMITSPDGRILDVNPAAEHIFGRSVAEIIEVGRNGILDLSDPRLPEALRTRQEKGFFVGELNFVRKDGSIFLGDVSSNIFIDQDGDQRTSMIIRDVSERKLLEKSLLESEERLRLAITSAQQGIYDLNFQTGDVIVNDIYAKMLGYDPETFQESVEGWKSRLHPDDYEYASQYFDDYVKGKFDNYELEFRLAKADGNYAWIYSSGNIVEHDQNGKPSRMLGTHTNITERKLAEHEKELYNIIIEETINEIYVFNAETYKFVQVNKAAISNIGYSMDELKEMTPVDLKPEISTKIFEEMVTPLRKGNLIQLVFETIHQRKDGTTYDVEVHLQLQKMENEHLFTAIILDISDRKKSEKILFEERQRLASIIEGTNVGTWEWNIPTGQIVINERWAKIVGYSLQELQPTSFETWRKLTHPDDLLISEERLEEYFSGKRDFYDVELRMKHKDGHWVWIQDRGKVNVWDEDGNPIVMRGTHHDITQRKQNEAKILEQLDELRRWHTVTLGREERIIELKHEINRLLVEMGEPPRYESVNTKDD